MNWKNLFFALVAALAVPRGCLGASAQLYPLTVLSDNPNAYWRLGETNGLVTHDAVHGHDCFLTNVQLNATGYSAIDPDKAALFGLLGSDNSYAGELDLASSGIANISFARPPGSNAEFSVEAWVNGGLQTNPAGLVTKGHGNGGEQFSLDTGSEIMARNGFRFTIHDAGGTNHSAASTVAPDGRWHHLVGVCDEPQGWVRLYLDGLMTASAPVPRLAGILTATNNAPPGSGLVSIGAKTSSAKATNFANQFVGTIDEVAIYGYALNDAQVQAHYEAGQAALRFTHVAQREGALLLNVSGGLTKGICTLLASTNLAVAVTNWTVIATNVCDPNGGFMVTNSMVPPTPHQFLALQTAQASAALWIPPFGAWLGAEVTNGLNRLAVSDHEANIGRQLDILRGYHSLSNWTNLTATELTYLNAGRRLFLSFKPDPNWSNAVGVALGGDVNVDGKLTSLAQSIATIKPLKLMLCVWHEPENDVNTAGTTNQYVAMWHNVRNIFDANGATNVIWVWIAINSGPFYRELLPGLWPGNAYVDWIGWDVYQAGHDIDYVARQSDAYNYLVSNSDTLHAYTAKPWAWTEWGIGSQGWIPTAADQINTFNAVNAALNSGMFPRVRYVAYFDQDNGGQGNATSAILPGAWGAYRNLANSRYLMQQSLP